MAEKEKKLTIKQRKFIKYYVELGNVTQAAKKAGYKHREAAYTFLQNSTVVHMFQELMDKHGITDEKLNAVLAEGLNANKVISANIVQVKNDDPTVQDKEAHAKTMDFIDIPDHSTRHRFLETAFKLKEKLKQIINIDNSKHEHFTRIYIPEPYTREKLDASSRATD